MHGRTTVTHPRRAVTPGPGAAPGGGVVCALGSRHTHLVDGLQLANQRIQLCVGQFHDHGRTAPVRLRNLGNISSGGTCMTRAFSERVRYGWCVLACLSEASDSCSSLQCRASERRANADLPVEICDDRRANQRRLRLEHCAA